MKKLTLSLLALLSLMTLAAYADDRHMCCSGNASCCQDGEPCCQ